MSRTIDDQGIINPSSFISKMLYFFCFFLEWYEVFILVVCVTYKEKDMDLILYLDNYMQQMCVSSMFRSKDTEVEAKRNFKSIGVCRNSIKKCLKVFSCFFSQSAHCLFFNDFFEPKS